MTKAQAPRQAWPDQELEAIGQAATRQVLEALTWSETLKIEPTALIGCLRELECMLRATDGAAQTIQVLSSGRRLLNDHENISIVRK